MRKSIKFLLLLFMIVLPLKVSAYGVQFTCQKAIKVNTTFECVIYSPSICTEITMELKLPNGFVLQNEKVDKNFKSLSVDNNLSYIATGKIDKIITVLTIKAPNEVENENNTIELSNIKYKYTINDSEFEMKSSIKEDIKLIGTNKTTTTTDNIKNLVLTLHSNTEDEMQTLSCTPTNGSCELSLANLNIPNKAGYIFTGWGLDKECTNGEMTKYLIKENTSLYACFLLNNSATDLKKLIIDGYPINFNSKEYNYEITVNSDVEDLNIYTEAYNETAKIIVSIPKLDQKENTITIKVTLDNEEKIYTIIVKKDIKENPIVELPLLSSLVIAGYPINFDANITEYNIEINRNETSLDITAIGENDANVVIQGNENLINGSSINILVSENDFINSYIINISKKDSLFTQYYYYIIALIIAIFMFIVYFIVKYYKNKDKTNSNKSKKEKKKSNNEEKKQNNSSEPIETLDI